MKVFFSCSTRDITKHSKAYKQIRNRIKSLGHILTEDWLDRAIKKAKAGKSELEVAESLVNTRVMSAILASDVVILDGTVKSTSIGYQLAYAMEKEKPVLFMAQDSQEKLDQLFSDRPEGHLLTVKNYNKDSAEKVIDEFLENNDGKLKVRFNLVMDKHHDNYIEWAAFNKNASKTEIIKKAIEEYMKTDSSYQKYLMKE